MTKRAILPNHLGTLPDEASPLDRTEQMIAIVDYCTAAKALADALDDRFLSYLLSMTIQEARTRLRPDQELAVALLADPTRN